MAPNLIRLSDSVEKAMYSRIHQCESEYSVIGSDLGSSKTEIYSLSDQDTASLSSFQGKVENEADKVSVSEQWCEDIPWCESTNGKNSEKLGEFYTNMYIDLFYKYTKVFHRVMPIVYKSSTYLHFWNPRISP